MPFWYKSTGLFVGVELPLFFYQVCIMSVSVLWYLFSGDVTWNSAG